MKEHLPLLKRVSELLVIDGEPTFTTAIYKTPAQSLREAADSLEAKEKTIYEFRHLIHELENE